MLCRTLDEVLAAARQDALSDPPYTQEQVDYFAALTAPHLDRLRREPATA